MIQTDSRFIIIAGTARNVGKTTLACGLIKKLSKTKEIIGVKFICLKKGAYQHKHHDEVDAYEIFEEIDTSSEKDSAKMLLAGARKSFFIVSHEEYIKQALSELYQLINIDDVVVVESACIRNYIKPKDFIIVDKDNSEPKKNYINALIPLADYQIDSGKDDMFEHFLNNFSE